MNFGLRGPNRDALARVARRAKKHGVNLVGASTLPAARQAIFAAPFDALAYSGMQINGSMEASQENGSTLITAPAGYVLDQWSAAKNGSMVINAQQVSDAPPGYSKSLKLTVTTSATPGAGDYAFAYTLIEGYRVSRLALGSVNAQPFTIGFWDKKHRPGVYSGSINNAGSTRSYPFSYVINVADTWEWKMVTIPGDTAGTWLTTTGIGMQVNFAMAVGTTFAGAANTWAGANYLGVTGSTNGVAATTDTFQITGFIILPGLVVADENFKREFAARSPLIMRPFDQELLLCNRHYYKSGDTNDASFSMFNTSNLYGVYRYPVPMRASPTVIIRDGTTNNQVGTIGGGTAAVTGITAASATGFGVVQSAAAFTGASQFNVIANARL